MGNFQGPDTHTLHLDATFCLQLKTPAYSLSSCVQLCLEAFVLTIGAFCLQMKLCSGILVKSTEVSGISCEVFGEVLGFFNAPLGPL